MSDDVAVQVDSLWKRYGLPLGPAIRGGLRRRWWRNVEKPDADGPWALRDVNLQVKRGETLGIIGRNGAGKSTLLKVLAGVTPPTRGTAEVRGRVFPMVELNAGLHVELTGRENTLLLGAIMGLPPSEMKTRINDIIEFCELGEWFDQPVRKYSTGMLARLGFGVAMNVDADILLIDEVLAVGDLGFQKKCFDKIEELRKRDIAILIVSHSIRQIQRISDRVVMFDEATLVAEGTPQEVTLLFAQQNSDRASAEEKRHDSGATAIIEGTGEVIVTSVDLFDSKGQRSEVFHTGDELTVHVQLDMRKHVERVIAGFSIFTSDFIQVCNFKCELDHSGGPVAGRSELRCIIPSLRLLPGVYSITANIKDWNNRTIFMGHDLASFRIRPSEGSVIADGLVYLDCDWHYQPPQKSLKSPVEANIARLKC